MLRAYRPWLPVVLWMGFIFVMSTHLGGSDETSRFIGPLLRWLLPRAAPETITRLHFLIRKAGHLTEYAILALLLLRAIGASRHPGAPGYKAQGLALLIAVAYAATDEFHQSFVPGRGASPGDVLIDTAGAGVALAVVAMWTKRARLR